MPYIAPTRPKVLPLHGLKILGALLESNPALWVPEVAALALTGHFASFLSLDSPNNNVHNLRVLRALLVSTRGGRVLGGGGEERRGRGRGAKPPCPLLRSLAPLPFPSRPLILSLALRRESSRTLSLPTLYISPPPTYHCYPPQKKARGAVSLEEAARLAMPGGVREVLQYAHENEVRSLASYPARNEHETLYSFSLLIAPPIFCLLPPPPHI